MAEALPSVMVDGIDLDRASIAAAEVNRLTSQAADRVSFQVRDAAEMAGAGYDLVTMFEMLHDLSRPVAALRTARATLREGGVVLVADEPTAEEFLGRPDAMEARQFGWSVLACLPMSLVEPGSAATGAVMRPSTLRRYADEAGFSSVDVLGPAEPDTESLRLYLLRP
jgi:2-polyprenyl-3-methyl-5-hydroxy-6-metoxy-1,4-benzoquinol methylase